MRTQLRRWHSKNLLIRILYQINHEGPAAAPVHHPIAVDIPVLRHCNGCNCSEYDSLSLSMTLYGFAPFMCCVCNVFRPLHAVGHASSHTFEPQCNSNALDFVCFDGARYVVCHEISEMRDAAGFWPHVRQRFICPETQFWQFLQLRDAP